MAQFTLQLRELESLEGRDALKEWFKDYDLHDYLTQKQIDLIENRGVWSKDKLADLIIDHYYMREIGLETPALFKLKLKVAMREIMEEKAQLIWSASLDIDPTNEFEINSSSDTNGKTHTEGNGNSLNIHSNTPQGNINKTDILNGTYASDTDGAENQTNTNGSDETHNQSRTYGRNRSQALLIREYRQNILMINREIIEDLAQLFIGIY
jgi:hypothetical protein